MNKPLENNLVVCGRIQPPKKLIIKMKCHRKIFILRDHPRAIYFIACHTQLTQSLSIPVKFDADKDLFDRQSYEQLHVDAFAFVKHCRTEDFHSIDSSDCYLYCLNYSLPLLAKLY